MLPINKNSFKELLKSLEEIVKTGVEAEELIRAILFVWAKSIVPNLVFQNEPKHALTTLDIVKSFSDWLSSNEVLISAFWLSSAYSLLLSNEKRKKSAMFFTPPELSKRMIRNAGSLLYKGKIIDPACGGAAFLAPVASTIAESMSLQGATSEQILKHIENNLYGVDKEEFLCELSSNFLMIVLFQHIEIAGRYPKLNILCGNGLDAYVSMNGLFDIVLSNPPYRKLTKEETLPLLPKYQSVIIGQANIYAIFIKHSTNLLKSGGKAILLTPMSYLSGRYFSGLRKSLVESGELHQLDLIHDKQGVFLGAEQDAVVTVWGKGSKHDKQVLVNSLSLSGEIQSNGFLTLISTDSPWAIPKANSDVELLSLFTNKSHNLTTYGFQSRTGSIVVHRDTRVRFRKFKDGVKAKAKALRPLIWQRDIGIDGRLKFLDSTEAKDKYIDVIDPESPAIIKFPCVVLQRVTSSDQKRRLICAPVSIDFINEYGGVVGENHVCFIEQINKKSEVDYILLSEILRTDVMDRLFRCISGSTNVSSYELNNLPFPNPALLKAEIRKGSSMENAVRVAFGLN